MARPESSRSRIRLFPGQFEALQLDAPELLLASSERGVPAGASWLLRVLAVRACASKPNTNVLIVQKNEGDLRRDHLAGESGLLAMVRAMQAHGSVIVEQDKIRFVRPGRDSRDSGESTIRWGGCSREAEVSRLFDHRTDVLLVDHAEEIPEGVFTRLREAVLASPRPDRRIVAAAASATDSGWMARHWSVNGSSGRQVFLLDPGDLDPELIRRPAFQSYREWLDLNFSGSFIWAPHTPSIVDAVDRWLNNEFDHLAIFVPSQHGKTEIGPRHAIPYIEQRYPSDWCAVISYNAKISSRRSSDARANFQRVGGELEPGHKTVQEWKTLAGGGCWSAGMASGQTGNPSSWVFLDDPDADWADAVNAGQQSKKRTRYGSVLRARESMFAAEMRRQKLCATVTRWDPGDLIGYAMGQSHEALMENPLARGERWGILALSAIYDPEVNAGYRQMYPLFEVLPDYRTVPGEPLWPERRNAEDWRVTFKIRGPIIAACECQQSPRGVERGGQFESSWFVPKLRDPAFISTAPCEEIYEACTRAWDLAATEGAGDWTAGSKTGRTRDGGEIVVRHVVRAQHAPRGVKQLIAACMIADGPAVKIRVPNDPAAGGQAAADEIVRYLREVAGWVGIPVPEIVVKRPRKGATQNQTAKAARAHDFQSRAQPPGEKMLGGVCFVQASWEPALSNVVRDWALRLAAHPELAEIAAKAAHFAGDWWTGWLQEFQAFTGDDGREDDRVDATVDSYEEVYQEPPVEAMSVWAPRPPGW